MINILISDDNLYYATNLMNYLNLYDNIKVCSIAKNGKETVDILNNSDIIDIILLDYKMPIYTGTQVLEKIANKEKYSNSCIFISGELDTVGNLCENDIVYDVLFKSIDMQKILLKINELVIYKDKTKKHIELKNKILNELAYLGYNMSHKGTNYLAFAIEYIIIHSNKEFDNLEKDIYPKIGKKYKQSTHNIKSNINRATNFMYYECEVTKLKAYFKFYNDIKPRVKTIINTIINKII